MEKIRKLYENCSDLFPKASFLESGIEILKFAQWAIGKNLETFKLRYNTSLREIRVPEPDFNYRFISSPKGEEISYLEGELHLQDGQCTFIFMGGECISVSVLTYNDLPAGLMLFFCNKTYQPIKVGEEYLNGKIIISYVYSKPDCAAGFFITSMPFSRH